jgi:DNA-binding NarL/FixJ family response regulator
VPRVLLGDFGAIARLGLRDFLADEGFDVVAGGGTYGELVESLEGVGADVVVVDLDMDDGDSVAAGLARAFPEVKVIACSSERPTMLVFAPFSRGESYETELGAATLAAAVRSLE